ncbi:MAG TPA: DUF2975 domain-containing protein [Allosphingosinicella sp.]|jgi:hypothetical protein
MARSSSAALPIAHMLLRILILLNWLLAAAVLVLLLLMPTERWIMTELALTPSPEAKRLVAGLRAIAVIGLVALPLNHLVLTRLLAMVGTVRVGDPFVAPNAQRLRTIAWALLALQLIGLVIAAVAKAVSIPGRPPLDIDAGFSIAGWLAVLLAFVLARVFAEGARMREDLEGTI